MDRLFIVAVVAGFAISVSAAGQAPLIPDKQVPLKAEDVGATEGIPIPTGLSYFANADNYHNLTVGVQAGLGTSPKSPTFGYDNLAVSLQKQLGDNYIGKRLSFLVGFSDWRVPAYRKVFPDSVIAPLPNQERFASQSGNSLAAGISLSLGRADGLKLTYTAAQQVAAQARAQLLDSDTYQPLEEAARKTLEEEIASTRQALSSKKDGVSATDLLRKMVALEVARLSEGHRDKEYISSSKKAQWEAELRAVPAEIRRAQHQQFGFKAGTLVRAASLAQETSIEAFDAFISIAQGYKDVDFALASHYLGYLDKKLPKHAVTLAGGAYVNTTTQGTSTVGITVGYGWYTFSELYEVIPEARHLNKQPTTGRFDVVFSFSGAPGKDAQLPAGVGVQISHFTPSLLPASTTYSLLFSTNFSLIK